MSTALFCIRCRARLEPSMSIWCVSCAEERQQQIDEAWRRFRGGAPWGWHVTDEQIAYTAVTADDWVMAEGQGRERFREEEP